MSRKVMSAFLFFLFSFNTIMLSQGSETFSWRYYRASNTGIQGDENEAIWLDHNGDPYIGGYQPVFEQGGFAKFVQSENRWENYSNIDYPVIGNPANVGASRVSDIAEASNGVLWMATWRGVLQFDPAIGANSLQLFDVNNSPFPGGRAIGVDTAPDGTVWAAVFGVSWGSGGLMRYNPDSGNWTVWDVNTNDNNWPAVSSCTRVNVVPNASGGYTVWTKDDLFNNLISFDSNTQLFTVHPIANSPGEPVSIPVDDCVDAAGNFWMNRYISSTQISLDYQRQDGTWVTPALPTPNLDIWAFKAYGNEKALMVDGNSAVWQFDGSSWQNLGVWRTGGFSYDADIDADGNIWVCGKGGAAKRDVNTGIWQRYRVTNTSQMEYFLNDLTIDDNGNVWTTANAAAGIGGFQKFDGVRWTAFNEANYGLGYPFPFLADNCKAIAARSATGGVVFSPTFNGISEWDENGYSTIEEFTNIENLLEDSFGRIWAQDVSFSLRYYEDGGWNDVGAAGPAGNLKKDPTRPGTVWATGFFEVVRADGNYRFSRFNDDFPELNPQSEGFTTVAPGENGIAWVGSDAGMFRLNANDSTYQFFGPDNSEIPGDRIAPYAVSPDGKVWFSNFNNNSGDTPGLGWFDGTTFGVFPVEAGGLAHAQIENIEVRILTDGYELWINTVSQGISVLTVKSDPLAIADTETGEIPDNFELAQNFPNPFNPETSIRFFLPQSQTVRLEIYNMLGQTVKTLTEPAILSAGWHEVKWNGTNHLGETVANGLYLYRLSAGQFSQTRKMILLK